MVAGPNPFEAPRVDPIEPAAPAQPAAEGLFFNVSVLKLAVMSVVTFGIYEVFWFYKNWKLIAARDPTVGHPFWRAVFAVFFCHPLFKQIASSGRSTGARFDLPAGALTVAYVLLMICWRLPDPYSLISTLSLLPLLIVQDTVNQIRARATPEVPANASFSAANIIACMILGPLWLYSVYATLTA